MYQITILEEVIKTYKVFANDIRRKCPKNTPIMISLPSSKGFFATFHVKKFSLHAFQKQRSQLDNVIQ